MELYMRAQAHPSLIDRYGKKAIDDLLADFRDWQVEGGGDDDHYAFGRDVVHRDPQIDWPDADLKHVHLVPMADPSELARWDKAWNRSGRRASDRLLMYVANGTEYLLLYLLDDGGAVSAHDIIEMRTVDHQRFMYALAQIADAFVERGEILPLTALNPLP